MYTDIAPAVREDFRSGLFTKAELGKKYKCHPETITNILNRVRVPKESERNNQTIVSRKKTKRDRHEPILVDDQIYQVKENACPKK